MREELRGQSQEDFEDAKGISGWSYGIGRVCERRPCLLWRLSPPLFSVDHLMLSGFACWEVCSCEAVRTKFQQASTAGPQRSCHYVVSGT